MHRIKAIFAALFMMLLIPACATKQTAEVVEFSGYLGDYSKLKETKDEVGNDVLRWQSSEFKLERYKKLMIDKIIVYPEPKPTEQFTLDVIAEVHEYTNEAVRREVSKAISITDQPGPDVLRLRIALTGVSTSAEGLKGYEYIPIAAIVAGVSKASGARDREVFILFEAEILDSMTGKRMVMQVNKRKAKTMLKDDQEKVTLDRVREIADNGAEQTRMFFEQNKLK